MAEDLFRIELFKKKFFKNKKNLNFISRLQRECKVYRR